MNVMLIEEYKIKRNDFYNESKKAKLKNILFNIKYTKYYLFVISFFILIYLLNSISLFKYLENHQNTLKASYSDQVILEDKKDFINKTNIDFNDEFFQLKEVKQQITKKNLTFIETISGGIGKLGNALIILNNLINICENIHCKNIIAPFGLSTIIKNPIFYREYNINILPNSYLDKIKPDIKISTNGIFYFSYKTKKNKMRLNIIKNEVFSNIPKYNANPNDLYIHIRSGDIFKNCIHPLYSQPPLCFYIKIIKENKFQNIYMISNGNENPVISELLKVYPNIKFINTLKEEAVSIILNAYNLVMSVSTFLMTLIRLNSNLKKIYIYEIINYKLRDANYTIYGMKPSLNYYKKMKGKWKNTKSQHNLMIKENCINNSFLKITFKDDNSRFFSFI